MKKIILLAALGITTLSITSCHKQVFKGQGNIESETRTLTDFKKINLSGSTPVNIVKDDEYKVVITGYANLIPVYKTDVVGERLHIKLKNGYWNVKNNNITVEVHTPYVDEVRVSGSGTVDVQSGYNQNNFRSDISGSGDINVHNNTYKELDVKISGSGEFNAETTDVENADIDISGSGKATVKVSRHLNVKISGSGDVYYIGNPLIDKNISGSGEVRYKN